MSSSNFSSNFNRNSLMGLYGTQGFEPTSPSETIRRATPPESSNLRRNPESEKTLSEPLFGMHGRISGLSSFSISYSSSLPFSPPNAMVRNVTPINSSNRTITSLEVPLPIGTTLHLPARVTTLSDESVPPAIVIKPLPEVVATPEVEKDYLSENSLNPIPDRLARSSNKKRKNERIRSGWLLEHRKITRVNELDIPEDPIAREHMQAVRRRYAEIRINGDGVRAVPQPSKQTMTTTTPITATTVFTRATTTTTQSALFESRSNNRGEGASEEVVEENQQPQKEMNNEASLEKNKAFARKIIAKNKALRRKLPEQNRVTEWSWEQLTVDHFHAERVRNACESQSEPQSHSQRGQEGSVLELFHSINQLAHAREGLNQEERGIRNRFRRNTRSTAEIQPWSWQDETKNMGNN